MVTPPVGMDGLLEAVAAACAKCWRADHPPPPASALCLIEDYKRYYGNALRREGVAIRLAAENGYDGTANELQYAAHREAYARTGDDADLTRMLRHV